MIDLKLSFPKKSYCMRANKKIARIFAELTASTFEVVKYLLNSLWWPIWSIFIVHPSNLTVKCRIRYQVGEKKNNLDLEQALVAKNTTIWGSLPFPFHRSVCFFCFLFLSLYSTCFLACIGIFFLSAAWCCWHWPVVILGFSGTAHWDKKQQPGSPLLCSRAFSL